MDLIESSSIFLGWSFKTLKFVCESSTGFDATLHVNAIEKLKEMIGTHSDCMKKESPAKKI